MMRPRLLQFGYFVILILAFGIVGRAQTTEFTYQGNLDDNAQPANGNYDFEFTLFNVQTGGSQIGNTLSVNDVSVVDGVFSLQLDFGTLFTGSDRFLEIGVRPSSNPGGSFTVLAPRQPVTSAPYAVKSLNAENALNAIAADRAGDSSRLGGILASEFIREGDPRLTNARTPTAGSPDYIQNSTSQQLSSDFNISGTGKADQFDAVTQYNLNGNRIISTAGSENLFVGAGSGTNNGSGFWNTFVGTLAGNSNIVGTGNAYFGASAGTDSTGNSNSFFGNRAGWLNTSGAANSFFGRRSGVGNLDGSFNTFVGYESGVTNVNGFRNTVLGSLADVAATNLTYATVIGAEAVVTASNTVQLGRDTLDTVRVGKLGANGSTVLCQNGTKEISGCTGSFIFEGDPRLTDARTPTAGSPDYIQNSTSQQLSSDFNISGTGKADQFDAVTQYNLNGNRIISTAGSENLFVGAGSGTNNGSGFWNTFVGTLAGNSNIVGTGNAYFGASAGTDSTGNSNSFFGNRAGWLNTSGAANSFFGRRSGVGNLDGSFNTFVGYESGVTNVNGFRNTVLGSLADVAATNLTYATVIGAEAVVTASNTVQLGRDTLDTVRVGKLGAAGPTVLCQNGLKEISGCTSNFVFDGDPRLTNARTPTAGSPDYIQNSSTQQTASNFNISGNGTADKFDAVTQYNLNGQRILSNPGTGNLFAGILAGNSNSSGNSNSFFGFWAGRETTTSGSNSYFGYRAGGANTTGSSNSFLGAFAGFENTTGSGNSFFGNFTGSDTTTGGGNAFFGSQAGRTNTTGRFNTAVGQLADIGSTNLENATAIGNRAQVDTSNSLVLGSINGVNSATEDTNVGIGTTSPTERLHIAVNNGQVLIGDAGCSSGNTAIGFGTTLSGCTNYSIRGNGTGTYLNRPSGGAIFFRENNITQFRINSGGTLSVNFLGSAGSTSLCRNGSNEIATCSSSIRYKSNIENFNSGLELIKKLRPVSFNWTKGGMPDVGLVAEEVAEAEPLLTTTVDGRVEGVKYDRVGVVLVNAVNEQQEQIEALNEKEKKQSENADKQAQEIERLQNEVKALKAIVCELKPDAAVCKED